MAIENLEGVEEALRTICEQLPKGLMHRFLNTFDHFDRAEVLFTIDREMASFRSITGEEEAATALMLVLRLRKVAGSERLDPRKHYHKAAVVACVIAIGRSMQPALSKFQLVFDFNQSRIDVKVPLSNFGVRGGESVAIQLLEPLGVVHSSPGRAEHEALDGALVKAFEGGTFKDLKKHVNLRANQRNLLLYASDEGTPKSQATIETIRERRQTATALLILAVMVFQTREDLPLVRQALSALGKAI